MCFNRRDDCDCICVRQGLLGTRVWSLHFTALAAARLAQVPWSRRPLPSSPAAEKRLLAKPPGSGLLDSRRLYKFLVGVYRYRHASPARPRACTRRSNWRGPPRNVAHDEVYLILLALRDHTEHCCSFGVAPERRPHPGRIHLVACGQMAIVARKESGLAVRERPRLVTGARLWWQQLGALTWKNFVIRRVPPPQSTWRQHRESAAQGIARQPAA